LTDADDPVFFLNRAEDGILRLRRAVPPLNVTSAQRPVAGGASPSKMARRLNWRRLVPGGSIARGTALPGCAIISIFSLMPWR